MTIEDLVRPPLAELPAVRDVLKETGRFVGIAVANLVSTFNPDMVILGGELARAGDLLLDEVREVVKNHIPRQIEEAVQVVASKMTEDPPLMGAYALALERIFDMADWQRRQA